MFTKTVGVNCNNQTEINKSNLFENAAKLRYFGMPLTDQDCKLEEIRGSLN
jgi:hypothetical protein